jgi:hypothetical protein
VPDRIDAIAGLTSPERARLERFAEAFERIDASSYPMFTETVETDAVQEAQDRAIDLVGKGPRRDAIRSAVNAFVDEGTRAYSRRMSLTDTFLLFQSLPDRAEDRVRFLATVERAVVGLILWGELGDDDRAALIGPWAAIVDSLG